jgi:hypothetical protein
MVHNGSDSDPATVPEQESAVRRMIAEARGLPFHPLSSLKQAQSQPDGVAILEGDWGGQIYVVCPAPLIHCSEAALGRLLRDLDKIAWECNDGEGAALFYERRPPGSGVAGGMGGGRVTDDLWVHKEFVDLGLADKIREVIVAHCESIM